jgi:hypothetical protein
MQLTQKQGHLILTGLLLVLWLSDLFVTPNWTGGIISTLLLILQGVNLKHLFFKKQS